MPQNQFDLLKQTRFRPFFITQFLGAFNDNVLKNALLVLITFEFFQNHPGDADFWTNLAQGLFILPFFLFSASAGQLADKFDKDAIIRQVKLAEIAIMALAVIGFQLNSFAILLAVLFLMGAQSAFFGPVKYSILPQHLRPNELLAGNALVEMGTFVAILLGTIVGGLLIKTANGATWISVALLLVAIFGYLISRRIPRAEAAQPSVCFNWNLFAETARVIRHARGDRSIFLSVLGISWFWFYGALILAQMPNFAQRYLHGNNEVLTLLIAAFTIGIALGSLLCERLSGRRIEIGLVPLGALGMTLFALQLWASSPEPVASATLMDAATFLRHGSGVSALFAVVAIGIFGGWYIVPLYALVQQRSEAHMRSRIIAANNVLNAGFMVAAAVTAMILLGAGLSIPQLFLVTAILNALVTWYIFHQVPEFLLRFAIWLLLHTLYRVRHRGLENIPTEGAAVLVSNHVSFVDALIIGGYANRPVRFVMDYRIFETPILRWLFRIARAIPIASEKEDAALKQRAFAAIATALEQGELVMIFPEGRLTSDGEINHFRRGIEHIVATTPVAVIPMALRGLWGSFFSRKGGPAMSGLPRKWFARIEIVAEEALAPAAVEAKKLELQIRRMRGDQR